MPGDFALRICSSPPPPYRKRLTCYEELQHPRKETPLRPCLQHRTPELATQKRTKKRVVFADSVGLALTAVHLFSRADEDSWELRLSLAKMQTLRPLAPTLTRSYILGFKLPASDYPDFRSRLQQNRVCLEHCLIQDRTLMGTVKVQNVAFEKKVTVRITFDLWQNFQDFPCHYLWPSYGGMDTDAFSFHIPLPAGPSLQYPAHFCISFQCDKGLYWDNNKGQNYSLQLNEGWGPPAFSYWPSWTTWDNLGPYW